MMKLKAKPLWSTLCGDEKHLQYKHSTIIQYQQQSKCTMKINQYLDAHYNFHYKLYRCCIKLY